MLYDVIWKKSLNFKYISVDITPIVSKELASNMVGKSDAENFPWSMFFESINKIDQKVVAGQNLFFIEYLKLTKYFFAFSHKKPLLNKNDKIIGIDGKTKILDNNISTQLLQIFASDDKAFGINNTKPYLLQEKYQKLTERETECLSLYVRSKSAKEIGRILGISHRTVEAHINHIKQKMNCFTKSQVIEKAFAEGFIKVIPKDIFLRNPIILASF